MEQCILGPNSISGLVTFGYPVNSILFFSSINCKFHYTGANKRVIKSF